MFESLFKFDRIHFEEGSVGFQSGSATALFIVMLIALIAGLVLLYRTTDRFGRPRDRALSFGLRAAALLLLCLPLFEPVLITPDVVPDENFVAVLVDASESMNVPDGRANDRRIDEAGDLLFGDRGAVAPDLEEHFKVRYYTFGDQAQRVDTAATATAGFHGTNISSALDHVLSDFRGLPLAGVVMLTDGGDNSGDVPLNMAESFRGRDIPLHIVGLGRETADRERELLEAVVHRGIDEATGAEIDVKVRSWRAESDPVAISLYQGDDLVHTDRQILKGEGKIDQFTLYYEPEGTDAAEYSLRIDEAPDELNTANNTANVLIDPRQDTLRVLYIEGHPRRDFKFIKRALEDDPAVHFTSILRTGTGKFYRQGILQPDELSGGFPVSEEEMFGFRAVLFGDVEASHFSLDQLAMVERFVRVRGGGFGMLGGRVSFADGAYWDNPIAELLPVVLDPDRRTVVPRNFSDEEKPVEEQGFRFTPTPIGLENPILRLAASPSENQSRWSQMPGLTSVNLLGPVKPGAAVLAEKPDDEFGSREPLLMVQRYGKGRSAALATASTWRWQMLLDAEDGRHARFWRQFVRWLAASAPERVNVDLESDRFAPEEEIPVRVDVYDEGFLPVLDADVHGMLTDPFGTVSEVNFQPDLGDAQSYRATLLPSAEGVYSLDVAAVIDGSEVGRQTQSFLVRPSRKEYYDAVLKRPFLERLADEAGGYYYTPNDAGAITTNLRSRRTSTSIFTIDYLWDMPFLYGMVLVLLSAEWIWRRRKGLP